MEEMFDQNNEPVCRFGPGGEYGLVWPFEDAEAEKYQNSLMKVLLTLRDILYGTLSAGVNPNRLISHSTFSANSIKLIHKGINKYAPDDIEEESHSPATADIENRCEVPEQQMLFTDDSRISIGTFDKQKHRIRAHRRTARKRTSYILSGQGSLFDSNLKSARTA